MLPRSSNQTALCPLARTRAGNGRRIAGAARDPAEFIAAEEKRIARLRGLQPADLHRKLCESRNFMAGWAGLRQMGMSQLDMLWHTQDPAGVSDVAAFEDAAMADVSLFPRLSGPVSTTFQHLFAGGYSAGYYSYKWAEVLDADAFELFTERGLYDPPTAEAFKNEVLSKGGSEHPRILYRRFRGRDADPQALLRREGVGGTSAEGSSPAAVPHAPSGPTPGF